MFLLKIRPPPGLISRFVCPVSHQTRGPPSFSLSTGGAQRSSNRTVVVRCSRLKYERLYQVVLVQPDGSTLRLRHPLPRHILMMPVNISLLSEEERRSRLKSREVKTTKEEEDVLYEDDFSAEKYRHLWCKK